MKSEIEKQKYVPVSLEVIRFTTADLLIASSTDDPSIDLPIDPLP